MKVIFLGVGEAFDENYPNNSSLVVTDKSKLLLDCGFSIPAQVWKFDPDPNFLDIIYISHWHADHYFGLPALLFRMNQEGRVKPIKIISQKGFNKRLVELMELAYAGILEKFKFKMEIIEIKEQENLNFDGLGFSFAKTAHLIDNFAIRISEGANSMVYGGDGSPMFGAGFYGDLNFLILETYLHDREAIGHSSVVSAIKFAEDNNVKCLALTHINRDFRKNKLPKIKEEIKSNKVKIIIPEPLEEYKL